MANKLNVTTRLVRLEVNFCLERTKCWLFCE